MPKRNLLREVRALSNAKNEYPFATHEEWEAWEYWEGEYGDGDYDERNWELVGDGTLEDCIYALGNTISLELDSNMRDDIQYLSAEYDDQPKNFFEEMERRHQQRRQDIKKQCWKTGQAEGEGWRITRYEIEGGWTYLEPNSTP